MLTSHRLNFVYYNYNIDILHILNNLNNIVLFLFETHSMTSLLSIMLVYYQYLI